MGKVQRWDGSGPLCVGVELLILPELAIRYTHVAGDLVVLLSTPDVASAQLANFAPDYRVTIDVQRFESIQGDAAVVEAVWTVRKTAGGETRSNRTVAREPVQGQGFDALAAAHSRAIAKMSADIAAAIRAESEQKNSARQVQG